MKGETSPSLFLSLSLSMFAWVWCDFLLWQVNKFKLIWKSTLNDWSAFVEFPLHLYSPPTDHLCTNAQFEWLMWGKIVSSTCNLLFHLATLNVLGSSNLESLSLSLFLAGFFSLRQSMPGDLMMRMLQMKQPTKSRGYTVCLNVTVIEVKETLSWVKGRRERERERERERRWVNMKLNADQVNS